jgi:hypothetical protein
MVFDLLAVVFAGAVFCVVLDVLWRLAVGYSLAHSIMGVLVRFERSGGADGDN